MGLAGHMPVRIAILIVRRKKGLKPLPRLQPVLVLMRFVAKRSNRCFKECGDAATSKQITS
jgi:hypothetical protein